MTEHADPIDPRVAKGAVASAVAAALLDRAYYSMRVDGRVGEGTALSAIEWIENYPDEFWDVYAGPLLDRMEADALSGELYAGQPDPEG